MTKHLTARAMTCPGAIAALTVTVAMAVTTSMAAPAHATTQALASASRHPISTPPTLPAQVTAAIARAGLSVQTSEGWEAVTGSAGYVNWVRALASDLGIGSLGEYTSNDEAGRAILIFCGDDDNSVGFDVDGVPADSAANETNQTWTIGPDGGEPDAALRPGTAENITPIEGGWDIVGTVVRRYVSFIFS